MISSIPIDNNFVWGDQWNREDLSIFSLGHVLHPYNRARNSLIDHGYIRNMDGIVDTRQIGNDRFRPIDYGGRAVEGFCRPYPIKTCGNPVSLTFDLKTQYFKYTYTNNSATPKPGCETIIFIPEVHFGTDASEIVVIISDGSYRFDFENQQLFYCHDQTVSDHFIIIQSKKFYDQSCWHQCCRLL